ncbi:hypothetical protein DICVIV_04541 [Dictyocaulus viviparus]|uniref:Lipid-binding serum glycoprotein C-terminal domain-containing protein n=1 Tax=Dictyocaulus viviparus TaxID=29172 RepID=A0A0D8XXG3_DICVI|nr:hypothetical protein DICVIV_04541 [Dictyocaulus viviparus]
MFMNINVECREMMDVKQIILTIRQDAMKHRPYTMRTSYNGMDINLDSMRIVDVLPPEFDVEHLNVSRFRFHTHGGGMRYLGSYSTIYKTTREGQFEALLDDVRIHIDVEFLYEENQIKVIENTCDSKISEILLQLIPSMPLQILGLLKDRIQQSFRENVCPALLHFARKLAHIMTSLAAVEDFTSPQREPYHKCALPYERITSQFNSHGAIFSFKRCILRKTSDQHTSDSLVDAENLADQYRIPYLHFKTKVSLRMTQLNATFSDNSGYYRWCARYEINHIKTYDVHSNFEELVDISNNIEQQIKKHRSYLEDLMATYLNGELPLRLNPRIRLLPHPAIFRDRRIIFPINFKFDKKFLPVFQLFHASSFW